MVNDKAACNLNCECCYLPYEGIRSPESASRIIGNMRERYRISIAGSEILTDLNYLDVLKAADQKYILSNGLLPAKEPKILDTLKDYGIDELQMSMDYKSQKDSGSSMNSIVQAATKAAKDRDFWVRLACIVKPDNFTEVDEMCKQAQEMGADAMFFIRYIKSGSARLSDTKTLDSDQRAEFFSLVDETRKKYKKSDFEIRLNGNFGPKPGSKGEDLAEQNKYCYAGSKIFAIDPSDNVFGCPFMMDATSIGKLVDESRLAIDCNLCNGDRSKCITDLAY